MTKREKKIQDLATKRMRIIRDVTNGDTDSTEEAFQQITNITLAIRDLRDSMKGGTT